MKKKLAALLALSVCATTLMAACDNPAKGIYQKEDEATTYSAMTKLTEYNDFALEANQLSLVTFSKMDEANENKTVSVYNIELGKEVYKTTYAVATKTVVVTLDVCGFAVTSTTLDSEGKTTAKNVTAYDLGGTSLVSNDIAKRDFEKAEEANVVFKDVDNDYASDYVQVGTVVYKKSTKKGEEGTFVKSFDFDDRTVSGFKGTYSDGKFIYMEQHGVYTYNDDFTLLHYYEVPGYANGEIYVLDNGCYLVQYQYMVDPYTDEYDFYFANQEVKFNTVTEFVNPAKDKVKEIETDYFFAGFKRASDLEDVEMDGYAGLIFAEAKISNKMYTPLQHDVTLTVTKKGKIEEAPELIKNQKMGKKEAIVQQFADYFYVQDILGQGYLLNEKGKVQMTLNASKGVKHNAKYMIYNDKVYDSTLTEMTLPDGEFLPYGLMNDCVLLYKTVDGVVEIYKWDGATTTLFAKNNGSTEILANWNNGYKKSVTNVETGKTTYTYYNAAGTELASLAFNLTEKATAAEEKAYLYEGTEVTDTGSVTVYYLVK